MWNLYLDKSSDANLTVYNVHRNLITLVYRNDFFIANDL